MTRVLIAIVNLFLLLSLPLWGGFALLLYICIDYFNDDRAYLRDKWNSALTGKRLFWKD
jgi:hypothetical protein